MVRKYNSTERKKIVNKLEGITDKNYILNIYNIISSHTSIKNFSFNENGIFININILPDDCIELLLKYIKENESSTQFPNLIYEYNNTDDIDILVNMGHKFNNREKNIIKQTHINK